MVKMIFLIENFKRLQFFFVGTNYIYSYITSETRITCKLVKLSFEKSFFQKCNFFSDYLTVIFKLISVKYPNC